MAGEAEYQVATERKREITLQQHTGSRGRRQEAGQGYKLSKSNPIDLLPLLSWYLPAKKLLVTFLLCNTTPGPRATYRAISLTITANWGLSIQILEPVEDIPHLNHNSNHLFPPFLRQAGLKLVEDSPGSAFKELGLQASVYYARSRYQLLSSIHLPILS